MNTTLNEDGQQRVVDARFSDAGKMLTESQFAESWAIAGIMRDTIEATGTFRDKLTDMAHAFARTQKFDALKAEDILRNVYKERFGETMNVLRERLASQEEAARTQYQTDALLAAKEAVTLIRQNEQTPFYQAFDRTSFTLADALDITQAAAKRMMSEAFRASESQDLYEAGKAQEKAYRNQPDKAEQQNQPPRRSRQVQA